MKFVPSVFLILATTLAAPAAFAGAPSLVGELPTGKLLHVMVPPTAEDVPSAEIWDQIRKSDLMMSISIFESSNKKVTSFYKKQPCEFVRGKRLTCDASGDSPLAGTNYEVNPKSQAYECKSGCTAATPKILSLREPIVFDADPQDGGLVIDQHGP